MIHLLVTVIEMDSLIGQYSRLEQRILFKAFTKGKESHQRANIFAALVPIFSISLRNSHIRKNWRDAGARSIGQRDVYFRSPEI